MNFPALVSLLATAVAFVLFLLMVQETRAVAAGSDPLTNDVRAVGRRFPQFLIAAAVVLGMVLGHLLWP
jgi:hypothetical protein